MKLASFQGGGTRGKWQAVALQDLEIKTGQPIWKLFDLFGGTSVGAINAGLNVAGLSAVEVNSFFDRFAPEIFRASPWKVLSRLWDSAKYDPAPLEHALKALLGERTLADCKSRFIATAVDMATGRNVYFQSYGVSTEDESEIVIAPDSGIMLWQVLRASSAAQSYFPGFVWRDCVFWDGGSTGCNAPDLLVIEEARQFCSADQMEMISLGAGRTAWPYSGRDLINPRLRVVLESTLQIAYAGPATTQVWLARRQLGARHHRFDPWLDGDFAIDDASKETLAALTAAAKACPIVFDFNNL